MGLTDFIMILLAGGVGGLIGWQARALRQRDAQAADAAELAALRKQQELDAEKLAWREESEQRLREAFEALASSALKSNSELFMRQTSEQLDGVLKRLRGDWTTQHEQFKGVVQPVEKSLKELDTHVRTLEQKREGAYKALEQHIGDLSKAHRELRDETGHLRTALTTSSRARGQWGELQLRRIVEMAGLLKHVDFDEQSTAGGQRPDMLVNMPHAGVLPVDAKTSMEDFLKAQETDDETHRARHYKAHAAAMKNHVRTLGGKAYWAQFEKAPEVVVMFVPSESCMGATFAEEPGLIEYGLEQGVLIATPVTLYGLLKAVAFGWQQQSVADNAERIAREGKDLCDRLGTFLDHMRRSGKSLDGSVEAYNKAVASLETRVMPSARRLREYGASNKDLEAPTPSELQARLPTAGSGQNE